MKKILFLLVALTSAICVNAQKDVVLNIKHLMNGSPFAFNQQTTNDINDTMTFTRVEYYVSNISIIHDGGTVTPVTGKYLLVNANSSFSESLGSFNVTNVEGISFNIGVDPSENHNDPSAKPSSHPLAPQSPSMHWGWSAGYRFAAVEGLGSSKSNNAYEYHALWDQNYHNQTITLTGQNAGNQVMINLDADYALALSNVPVGSGGFYHGDNTDDAKVIENFRDKVFKAGSGTTAIDDIDLSDNVSVYPVPSSGQVTVKINDQLVAAKVNSLEVVDLLGRVVDRYTTDGRSELNISQTQSGAYFINLKADNEVVARKKMIIQ